MSIKEKLFVFIALAIIVAALYANSLKNGFFFDDYTEIIENPMVQHPENIFRHSMDKSKVITQDITHFRPFPFCYRAIIYPIYRQNAFCYHLTNVLFFLTLCYLLFHLIYLLTGDKSASLISTLLFCVHPQNTTPVNFVTGEGCLFYGIFCVLMAIYFIRFLQNRGKRKYYVISVLCYFLAVLSHDIAFFSFIVLFFIALGGHGQKPKFAFRLCVPYVICAMAYFLFRSVITPQAMAILKENAAGSHLSFVQVCLSSLGLIGWYMAELIVPVKFIYMWSLQTDPSQGVWRALGALIVIITGLYMAFRNKDSAKGISLFWFLSGFLPVPILMFTYYSSMGLVLEPLWFLFSSIGFFLYLGVILSIRLRNARINIFKYSVIFILMLYWGGWTIWYNHLWSTGLTYAQYWLEVVPENTYALRNIGQDYLRNGNPQQAIPYFNRILKKGEHYSIYYDIGRAYFKMGQSTEGFKYLMKALSLNPKDSMLANDLGVYFDNQNNFIEAQRYFALAIKDDPYNGEPLCNLATLYMRFGDFSNATHYLKNALEILSKTDNSRSAMLGKLVICYYKEGRFQEFHESLGLFISENKNRVAISNLIRLALQLKDINLAQAIAKVAQDYQE